MAQGSPQSDPSLGWLLEKSPRHVAEQLMLLQFELRKQLKAEELIGQAWSKRPQSAPTVLADAHRFDKVAKLVAWGVLSELDVAARARVFGFFLEAAAASVRSAPCPSPCAASPGATPRQTLGLRAHAPQPPLAGRARGFQLRVCLPRGP